MRVLLQAKMSGLTSRFKALEGEEAKVSLVKQENEDLQREIIRLVQVDPSLGTLPC